MTGPRRPALVALLTVGVLALAGCSGSDSDLPAAATSTPTSASAAPASPATPTPRPRTGSCHRLPYAAAVAPTDARGPVPCRRPHTTVTFAVGDLDDVATLVDGHLLAVDSSRVQRQLAATCPARLAAYVGGTAADLRTSMLRAIGFSPTVEAADAGADWYRCDATVLAAEDRLVPLTGGADLAGALDAADWRERYGMCGTADPASPGFARVVCSAPHRWEAIATTDAEDADGAPVAADAAYPGVGALTDAGTTACEDPARSRATDPLTVTWSYEPPTRGQWRGGQHYGICWVPTAS